jgi:hypothetical protein
MLKLDMISLVDAACIHSEVPQAVPLSLLCAEADLVEASLVTSKASFKLVEGDLLTRQPGMGEYSVGGHVAGAHQVFGERNCAVMLYLKQSHVVKEEFRSLLASGWTAWKRGSLLSCWIDRSRSRVLPLTSMDVGRCMFTHVHTCTHMGKRVDSLALLSIRAGYDGCVQLWVRQEDDHWTGLDVTKDSQHAPQPRPSWYGTDVQCRPLSVQNPAM